MYNHIFYTYALVIALTHCSERNNARAEKEVIDFVCVNIGFAAHWGMTFAEKHFDWCCEVYKNALKNLQWISCEYY